MSDAYEVIATFAARLAARGVTDVVISPGSRSTALVLSLDAQPALRTWVQLDERSAGFFALGLGRATGVPATLVCTSGTAAANYLPAVVEASHAGVPLIVCTADRPEELREGWGSPQTIDQINLYGTAVRWSVDLAALDVAPGKAETQTEAAAAAHWADHAFDSAMGTMRVESARAAHWADHAFDSAMGYARGARRSGLGVHRADDAFDSAAGTDPGPVHLNWPLREPLEPAGPVPVFAVRAASVPEHPVPAAGSISEHPAPAGSVPAAGSISEHPAPAGSVPAAGSISEHPAPAGSVPAAGSISEHPAPAGSVPAAGSGPMVTGIGDMPGDSQAESLPAGDVLDGREGASSAGGLRLLAGLAHEFERGVVVVGPWPGAGLQRERRWAIEAVRFAAWAGWPVIGEPISQIRGDLPGGDRLQQPCVVTTADHLLADRALSDAMAPDVVVLAGRTVTTKPVWLWIERTRPRHVVLIDPEDRWQRAVFRLTGHVVASPDALGSLTGEADPPRTAPPQTDRLSGTRSDAVTGSADRDHSERPAWVGTRSDGVPSADSGRAESGGWLETPGGWLETWRRIDAAARETLDAAIEGGPLLSARVARCLVDSLPEDSVLVASNSMPVRDLDAFVTRTGSLLCCANRGAAGIDGTASTALGIAAANGSRVVALYSGDLALLHDLGALAAAARLGLHLIVVCVDNDGGEIFSLLPVADRVPAADFERLFRTPHGLELGRLDGFAGIRARRAESSRALGEAVRRAASERRPGVDLLVIGIARDDDIAQRRALAAAAQQAARRALAVPARPGSCDIGAVAP